MKKFLLCAGAVALMTGPALAADYVFEVTTAHDHAALAAKADDLAGVHMHLQHALNCLVGSRGRGYDGTVTNPCSGKGGGAIPDSSLMQSSQLLPAVRQARDGIRETDLAAAQKDAADVVATIDAAHK